MVKYHEKTIKGVQGLSTVSIVKCDSYDDKKVMQAVMESFRNLGGVEKFIKPGMKVALKANLLMDKPPSSAVTTHPAVVKAVSALAREAGASVLIIDSPGGQYSKGLLKRIYSACGIEEAARETGAELNFDLSQCEVDNPLGKYLKKVTVTRPLIDADLVINLPKLKTHGQMVYTGAVKNMFGAVPGILKAEYHMKMAEYDRFADALIDIFLSVNPALTIMDAVVGMEGHGPSSGNPRKIGVLIASENAFELDMTALNIIGADPMAVPVIRNAVKRRLCPGNFSEIHIAGEDPGSVRIDDFDIPQLNSLRHILFIDNSLFKSFVSKINPKPVFNHGMCTGCSHCARNCPMKIIEMENSRPKANLSKCIRCFCCQELCPQSAITIKRPFIGRCLFAVAGPLANLYLRIRGSIRKSHTL